MPQGDQEQALSKAKTLAVLMKIAPHATHVDFDSPTSNELWESGATEDQLYYLDQEGAISFEAVGEDGFAPILICSTNARTAEHLLRYLGQIESDLNATKATLAEIYQHNPSELKKKIHASREHIENARITIRQNEILAPLARPLGEIQRHFDSLSKVADNYASVYSNILKPVQEEGKKGVRATVRWAIVGIVASVALSNFEKIKDLIFPAAG